VLAGIGLATVLAAAAPLLWQQWLDFSDSRGKAPTVVAVSQLSERTLMACLLKREPGSLTLQVYGQNHFVDEARDVAVEIIDRGADRQVVAWSAPGNPLRPGEAARIGACARPG
jgi:hypothetical protein